MIEQDIEAALVNQVEALELADATVSGFWQPSAPGVVKGREDSDFKALVSVAVSPRAFETFTTPVATITAAVATVVRRELCPTGAELATYISPLLRLLQSWQVSLADVKSAFPVEGFNVHGLRLESGDVSFDPGKAAWTVTHTIALRGVITERNTDQ